ncbi:MAG: hypothetical protein ACYTBZ_25215, partial [Planctomycetota bacterium]
LEKFCCFIDKDADDYYSEDHQGSALVKFFGFFSRGELPEWLQNRFLGAFLFGWAWVVLG